MEHAKKITREQFIKYTIRHHLDLETDYEDINGLCPGKYYLVAVQLREDGTVWTPDWDSDEESAWVQMDPEDILSGKKVWTRWNV
jgi:hypothetical protein